MDDDEINRSGWLIRAECLIVIIKWVVVMIIILIQTECNGVVPLICLCGQLKEIKFMYWLLWGIYGENVK